MNSFKTFVALAAFGLTVVLANNWINPTPQSFFGFLVSGAVGLMLGDYFMLRSMADIGASRMLMIFGIQPFLLAIGSYYLLGQPFTLFIFFGMISMVLCLFVFSLENYRKSGHWHLEGLIFGLCAVLFDAAGLLLTRYSFDQTPGIEPIQANFIRCLGAVSAFIIFYILVKPIAVIAPFKSLVKSDRVKLLVASLAGTYISLLFYLTAVSKGQLSVVSSVAVTGPLFAAIIECFIQKRRPNIYLFFGTILFLIGFMLFSKA